MVLLASALLPFQNKLLILLVLTHLFFFPFKDFENHRKMPCRAEKTTEGCNYYYCYYLHSQSPKCLENYF